MPSVTLATCAEVPAGDEDAALLEAALSALGVAPRWAVWNDPGVSWGDDLVVLRSTWDYTRHLAQFLAWADALPQLANPAGVVRWNTDKVYLRDLAQAGLPVVPTEFAAPGEPVVLPGAGEFVVKPSVGAGSRGAGRFTSEHQHAAITHATTLQDGGRTVLVQPYQAAVDTEGETALLYFDGAYSHAVRKGPMLPPGVAHPLDGWELFVPEEMRDRAAAPEQRAVADAALDYLTARFGVPLYARIDLLPGADGPVIVELELTEPSLFLGHDPHAPARFAAAVAARA